MKDNWTPYVLLFSLAILLPILVVIFFKFVARLLPVPDNCLKLREHAAQIKKKYKKWDLLAGLFFVIFAGAGGYLGWLVCHAFSGWRVSGFSGEFVLAPSAGICLMPSVPFALAMGIAVAFAFLRGTLGQARFREMQCYSALSMGFDVTGFLKWFFAVLFVLSLVGIILPCNCYMIVADDGLRFNPLLGIREREYRYADVSRVVQRTYVKNRFKKEVTVRLEFRDGEKWSSGNTQEIPNEKAIACAAYISDRSGVPVDKIVKKRK